LSNWLKGGLITLALMIIYVALIIIPNVLQSAEFSIDWLRILLWLIVAFIIGAIIGFIMDRFKSQNKSIKWILIIGVIVLIIIGSLIVLFLGNVTNKNRSLLNEAIATKDASLCAGIKTYPFTAGDKDKYLCVSAIATDKKDNKICDMLGGSPYLKECYADVEIAINHNYQLP